MAKTNIKRKMCNTSITNNLRLEIAWSDDHQSEFLMEWLKERSFDPKSQESYLRKVFMNGKKPWSAKKFPEIFKRYDYTCLMESDNNLLDWLIQMATFGVTLVENVGTELGAIKPFAERIAFLRRTQYGETFRVESRPEATNAAYKASALQLHVDLPYNHYIPGILFLHCISQSRDGGGSELVDCIHACHELRKQNLAVYKKLKSTYVDWSDIGEDGGYQFHTLYRAPVICEDTSGNIVRINFSQPQRDTHFNIPLEEVDSWYEAMNIFVQTLHHPDNKVAFKMQEGEMLVMDNTRFVHGRTGFEDTRLLEGGYMDWDLVLSKLRVLQKSLHT